MSVRLLEGDAIVRMAELPSGSVDACVSDPPYGLEFMSVAWDTFNDGRKGGERVPNTWGDHGSKEHPRNAYQTAHIAAKKNRAFGEFSEAWATEVLRVLKPGGYLVAFGGTRTYHRLTCAIEDSGFQIRDCLMWLYGSGFPKGKGCLKPGWEPIVLARKPAPAPWLNVDGCRIGFSGAADERESKNKNRHADFGSGPMTNQVFGKFERDRDNYDASGRWPANVVLSHEPPDEDGNGGCCEVGTVEIPSRGGSSRATALGRMNDDAWQPSEQKIARPSPTVAAWECVPGCAVRLLDEQTGTLDMGGSGRRALAGLAPLKRPAESLGYGGSSASETGLIRGYADQGGASRFFATFPSEDSCSGVSTAETSSSPSSALVGSAPSDAATLGSLEGSLSSDSTERSTSVTPNASGLPPESATPTTPCSDPKCLHESPRISIAQTIRANDAAQLGLTDITTTTASPSTSGICVGPAISNTTRNYSERGAAALPIETEGSLRFRYCAKASPSERRPYNDHPTVKPLSLMSWLVKLVTPIGGTVLDPFAGSGSTLIAADRLGFSAIGIDNDPHAVEIARRRIEDDAGPLMSPLEVPA